MKKTALILGLGLTFTVFGCGDDTSVTGAGGTGGAGGTAGSGGAGGTAGMGGAGGTAGMGGAGGTAGMGGAGGTAGMGGAGGTAGMGGAGGTAGMGGAGGTAGMGGAGGAGTVIAAGSGTTQWTYLTNSASGLGNGTAGGCAVFVTVINNTIYLDVLVDLTVTSDGANNISTSWNLQAYNSLLPVLQNAAQYGGFSIQAVATNASGGPIPSEAEPTAISPLQLIGAFLQPAVGGNTDFIQLATPDDITEGAATLTPTGGIGSMVNVNWDGSFLLNLFLNGAPLVDVDTATCTLTAAGAGVNFAVN